MTIKMIAVDMDGTFLNDQKAYNRERFDALFQQLKENKIKFVVASGNQYDQLKSFFPEKHRDISFVSENGANIIVEGEHYYNAKLSTDKVLATIQGINALDPIVNVACGKKSAYVSQEISEEVFKSVSFYYPSIKKLERLEDVVDQGDEIFKFALTFPSDGIEEKLAALDAVLGGEMIPVSSGHGDIDLIIPGVHKANGLAKLADAWGVAPAEIAAFGDSGNDIEMLEYAGFSFAMENAQEKVKQAAKEIIASNNQEGVLEMMEQLLNK